MTLPNPFFNIYEKLAMSSEDVAENYSEFFIRPIGF